MEHLSEEERGYVAGASAWLKFRTRVSKRTQQGACEWIVELATALNAARAETAEVRAQLDASGYLAPCTCGSGAHPRDCKRHPQGKALHAAEWDAENQRECRQDAERERDAALAEVARLKGLARIALSMAGASRNEAMNEEVARLSALIDAGEREGG